MYLGVLQCFWPQSIVWKCFTVPPWCLFKGHTVVELLKWLTLISNSVNDGKPILQAQTVLIGFNTESRLMFWMLIRQKYKGTHYGDWDWPGKKSLSAINSAYHRWLIMFILSPQSWYLRLFSGFCLWYVVRFFFFLQMLHMFRHMLKANQSEKKKEWY